MKVPCLGSCLFFASSRGYLSSQVIDAFSRSRAEHAGRSAEELLDQMRELHAAGNNDVEVRGVLTVPLVTALHAYARIASFHRELTCCPLVSRTQPDAVTYAR